jgi:hypothetical protein
VGIVFRKHRSARPPVGAGPETSGLSRGREIIAWFTSASAEVAGVAVPARVAQAAAVLDGALAVGEHHPLDGEQRVAGGPEQRGNRAVGGDRLSLAGAQHRAPN